jgi:hypothetical protein
MTSSPSLVNHSHSGLRVEQRTMREHHDRRRLRKAGQVFLEPCQLLRADFRVRSRDVVKRDKMHAAMVE